MSHLKERKETNCLNCNAEVMGTFCHICGQENVEPKESLLYLVRHFFEDITHFDGKFFTSVKYLIARPGFLSLEYMNGRRASYLNPVRMYVFTSAIFFLVFFSVNHPEDRKMDDVVKVDINKKSLQEIDAMDSAAFAKFTTDINANDGKPNKPMTRAEFGRYADSIIAGGLVSFSDRTYSSTAQYDSVQAASSDKDNWIEKKVMHKQIELNEKFKRSGNQMFSVLFAGLLHRLPQMIFISMPLIALLLKILYTRRRQFYFVSHGIFVIHVIIFIYVDILVVMAMGWLAASSHIAILNVAKSLLGFAAFFYIYKAMRNFYQQGRTKTIIKFVLFNLLCTLILAILFMVFFVFSFFNI